MGEVLVALPDLADEFVGQVIMTSGPGRAGSAPLVRRARAHLQWLAAAAGLATSRVKTVLTLTGLTGVAGKRVRGFSLGMTQRLGIAAALLGDPPVLLLDEPVNGLDPEGVLWIRTLMRSMAADGRTVFVSSHRMSEMALTADHLIVIGQGRLLADSPTTAFIGQHASLEQAYMELTAPATKFRAAGPGASP